MTRKTDTTGRAAFWGHGSPMNALADNDFTRALGAWGRSLDPPEAVIVISAHWQTRGTRISCQSAPKQIYDFHGFPDELYAVSYSCAGAPGWAKKLLAPLAPFKAACAGEWGIDHGAWTLLKHCFPRADVPIVQISLDMSRPPEYHYRLGQALRPLLNDNLLFLGSGNIVHNLDMISWEENAPVANWARDMDEAVAELLAKGDHAGLIIYPEAGVEARRGIPSLDHYLPMLVILGLQARGRGLRTLHAGFQNASLSMRAFELA